MNEYRFVVKCPKCGNTVARATHGGDVDLTCNPACGFEGQVTSIPAPLQVDVPQYDYPERRPPAHRGPGLFRRLFGN